MSEPIDGDKVRERRIEYGEQDAWGNSIGTLRLNLRLTPTQRLRQFEDFARFVFKYKGAANRRNKV